MASYDPDIVRAAAIELKEDLLPLYVAFLPIYRAVSAWKLNGYDTDLPLPYDVKLQLQAYRALSIKSLKLADWVTLILAAQPGDTYEGGSAAVFDEGGLTFG